MPDYDPYVEHVLDDPHQAYQQLRDDSPALFLEQYNAWFLARFDYVWDALQRPELSVAQGISPSQLLLGAPPGPLMPSQMDPPRHTAVRKMLSDSHFRPSRVNSIEDHVRTTARSLMATCRGLGRFDAVRDYAAPVAMDTACLLCGFPTTDAPLLTTFVNELFHRSPDHKGETEKAANGGRQLYSYVTEHLDRVRACPESMTALTLTLMTTPVDGATMTDDGVVSSLVNLLIAAADTFPKVFASLLERLYRDPDQRRRVLADPGLHLEAFHEALRIDTPTQFQGRTVTAAFGFDGYRFEPGQRVCFLFASANRDPREFPEPDRYRIDRRPKRMVGFGHGTHVCLGLHLARMEARVALQEFLDVIPDYEIDFDGARYARTEYVRGWLRLPVSPSVPAATGGSPWT